MIDRDDLRLVNCARCAKELLGESHAHLAALVRMPAVAARVLGRPYCAGCLAARRPPVPAARPDDIGPWQENAIRDLEEGG